MIAGSLVSGALFLPKLLAMFKRDKLDGTMSSTQQALVGDIQTSYEKQNVIRDERMRKLEEKVEAMDQLIHTQAVKITRLIVVIIHMRGLLNTHTVPVPDHIQAEIDHLLNIEEHKQ
jgi:hypothetical protein